jgi:hypothetical protein
MAHLDTSTTIVSGVNYRNPTYPETAHVDYTKSSGVQILIPSGQGHFAEQKVGNANRPSQDTTELDITLHSKDPYNVGSGNAVGLIDCPESISGYNFVAFKDNLLLYNDFGVSSGTIPNVAISFLRPAYSSTLKTSRFPIGRAGGITNPQAHALALDAATSGGGFNYLSNAYYYITTQSTVNFAEYQVIDRADYTGPLLYLNQTALSNNIASISQVSGTLADTLDY